MKCKIRRSGRTATEQTPSRGNRVFIERSISTKYLQYKYLQYSTCNYMFVRDGQIAKTGCHTTQAFLTMTKLSARQAFVPWPHLAPSLGPRNA